MLRRGLQNWNIGDLARLGDAVPGLLEVHVTGVPQLPPNTLGLFGPADELPPYRLGLFGAEKSCGGRESFGCYIYSIYIRSSFACIYTLRDYFALKLLYIINATLSKSFCI